MGGPGGQHLQGLAHCVGILDVLLGGRFDEGAHAVPDLHQVVPHQHLQGLPDGGAAHVQLLVQGHLAEHGAGGELIVQDTALQGVIGELCAAGLFLFDGQRATSFKTE